MNPHSALDELGVALLRRWRLVLLVAVPLLLGVLGYASTLPTTWTSTATVGFAPRPSVAVGSDTVSLLLPGYVAYVTSPGVVGALAAQYGLSVDALDDALDVAVPPTTATLEVQVSGAEPATVASLANGLARSAVSRATQDEVVQAELVAEAVAARATRSSGVRPLQLAGLLASLLTGLLVAAAVERGVPRVRTAGDVRRATGLDLLAALPYTPALLAPAGEAVDDPGVGVAVRALRNRLQGVSRLEPCLVVAVCSASRREGRTSVVSVLALAFARLGSRVLIVDADTASGGLTGEYTFEPPAEDLIGMLLGRSTFEQAVLPTGLPGVHLLPSRPHARVGDLLATRLPAVLSAVRDGASVRDGAVLAVAAGAPAGSAPALAAQRTDFDVVLIDTPPLLHDDAALLLAQQADGVLLVARDGRRAAALAEAATLLQSAGARTLGVVLDAASARPPLALRRHR